MLICAFYSAIGDEVTYRIALLLSQYKLSVGELVQALELKQPHVSHKLAKLRKYGCVKHSRQGRCVYYELALPCRTILLSGDRLWREVRPEHVDQWREDRKRLEGVVPALATRKIEIMVVSGQPGGD